MELILNFNGSDLYRTLGLLTAWSKSTHYVIDILPSLIKCNKTRALPATVEICNYLRIFISKS